MRIFKEEFRFLWFVFSEKGTQPDPNKIVSFVNIAQPHTASEVRSLLGVANHSAQFIKDFATIAKPLRKLTCKDTPFQRTSTHQATYEKLKIALTKSPVMSYFDITKETDSCGCKPSWFVCNSCSTRPQDKQVTNRSLCQPITD